MNKEHKRELELEFRELEYVEKNLRNSLEYVRTRIKSYSIEFGIVDTINIVSMKKRQIRAKLTDITQNEEWENEI